MADVMNTQWIYTNGGSITSTNNVPTQVTTYVPTSTVYYYYTFTADGVGRWEQAPPQPKPWIDPDLLLPEGI